MSAVKLFLVGKKYQRICHQGVDKLIVFEVCIELLDKCHSNSLFDARLLIVHGFILQIYFNFTC